ncbi:MAG TPA: hypothetical protein VFO80_10725 [Sphingomonas sp.]|nr:hypothetical protein [Sphingomonas sp.]
MMSRGTGRIMAADGLAWRATFGRSPVAHAQTEEIFSVVSQLRVSFAA